MEALLLLFLWRFGNYPSSRIAITAVAMFSDGAIYNDLRISGIEFIIGYVLAILVGIPLGIAMGWYGKINGSPHLLNQRFFQLDEGWDLK
ncbi:hypothetical protein [Peribacillus butanolivorans]|uniref:hypothetical protein n=1 Tax=Peribacillus butanolivorans TaxID=421767 RepID=UPI001145F89F|nr:hypothetical protein [Peribacillus butanolivorans]